MAGAGNRGHLWGEQHRIETRTKRNHSWVNSGCLTIGGNYSRSPLANLGSFDFDLFELCWLERTQKNFQACKRPKDSLVILVPTHMLGYEATQLRAIAEACN